MVFGRKFRYLVSLCPAKGYELIIPRMVQKKRGAETPLYRSDRGDICTDRTHGSPKELSDGWYCCETFPNRKDFPGLCGDYSMAGSPETAQVDGLAVRFERRGQGPAMVLVHGLLGYSFSWRRVLDVFSQQREVFAVDMPGSGFSQCSPALEAHLSAAAERLCRVLDALGVSSCDLVGSSYGGATSLLLAAKHPKRVRTLILVSPANPWSRIGGKRLALLSTPAIGSVFPAIARAVRPLHRISVRRMYGDPRRVSSETLKGYSLPLMRKGVFEHAVRITRNWRSDMRELEAALPIVSTIPTLLIWEARTG